jgi:hypothetical protein
MVRPSPRVTAIVAAGLLGVACAPGTWPRWQKPVQQPPVTLVRESPDIEIHHLAQREYNEYLEREIARLRADLAQAEAAMVAIESGLRAVHSRADAVSSLAEARIAVERLDARGRGCWCGHPGERSAGFMPRSSTGASGEDTLAASLDPRLRLGSGSWLARKCIRCGVA